MSELAKIHQEIVKIHQELEKYEEVNIQHIYEKLKGASLYDVIYYNSVLLINYQHLELSRKEIKEEGGNFGTASLDYAIVKRDTKLGPVPLDLSLSIGHIRYKCNCHNGCEGYTDCIIKCNGCRCGGITLPDLTNFVKFLISEKYSHMILIDSEEMYEKYRSIPSKFRFGHRFINSELDIAYLDYLDTMKHSQNVSKLARYCFDYSKQSKIITIRQSQDRSGIPFTEEIISEFYQYVGDYDIVVEIDTYGPIPIAMIKDVRQMTRHIKSSMTILIRIN